MNKIIVPYEIETVFPFRNISECKNNGLDTLISEFNSLSGKIALPIQFFGNIIMNFKFTNEYESSDFTSNYPDISNEKLFLIIKTHVEVDIYKIAEEAQFKQSNHEDVRPELFVLPYYRLLHN